MAINEITEKIPSITPIEPTEPTASAGYSSLGATEQSLLSAIEASSSGISPTASFLSHLLMLQEENPTEYSKAVVSISTHLQADAKAAAADGNTTQADALNHVASVFESAAQSGQLPTLDALYQAGLSHDHQHGQDSFQQILNASMLAPAALSPASDSIESIVDSEVSIAISSLNPPNPLDTLDTLNSTNSLDTLNAL
jgi:hypothetical protein